MIAAIAYIAITLYNIISATITSGFTALSFLSLVLPALYAWGYYQSKE